MKCPPNMTVKQGCRKFREAARSMDVVMYFYIVDETGKLLGVIDVKELFMAEDDELLRNVMVEQVTALNPENTNEAGSGNVPSLRFQGSSRHRRKRRDSGRCPLPRCHDPQASHVGLNDRMLNQDKGD
jgi:hypothetical protein